MGSPSRSFAPPATAAGSASRLLFASETLRVGRFEIAPETPGFAEAGQMRQAEFVFPRTSVWIEHADAPPFATDATLATLYNGGEPYRRRALDPDGDRCDWFAFAPGVLLDAIASVDPAIRERPERPFRFRHAPVDGLALLAQRQVARRLRAGDAHDPLAIEETMLAVLRRIVAAAYAGRDMRRAVPARESGRRLASDVKAFALPRVDERLTLDRIARAVEVSPFHLCRRFKAETGCTLHGWLLEVRLRRSLERVADARSDLAAVALDFGFATHSHFTTAFRRAFGTTPSAYRRQAAGVPRSRSGSDAAGGEHEVGIVHDELRSAARLG
jgi:AraC family transcriptional regulator